MRKNLWVYAIIPALILALVGMVGDGRAQDQSQEDEGHGGCFVHIWAWGGQSFLGISPEEVTAETVRRLGLPEERGALVVHVVPDSPAERAGLKKDDVILTWNGTPVESAVQLRRLIRETPPGRTVRLGIFRDGHQMELTVTLDKRSTWEKKWREDVEGLIGESLEQAGRALRNLDWEAFMVSRRGRLGVTLQSLTPQLAEYFGLKDRSGALITSVRKDSPADRAGLKAGDVIIAIDGQTVEDPSDAAGIIRRKEEGPVEIRIVREGHEMTVTATLEKRPRRHRRFAPPIEVYGAPWAPRPWMSIPPPGVPPTHIRPGWPAFRRMRPPVERQLITRTSPRIA